MKKILFFVTLSLMSIALMAQESFVGSSIIRQAAHYEDNFDVIVENVKSTIDKDTTMDAATKGMAKMMAKPIAKNALKNLELQKYITSYPDGEYRVFERWDGVNNRAMVFTPEIGRILIWLGNEGRLIVAYPNLKMVLDVTDPAYVTDLFRLSCAYIVPTADEQVQEINGFRAVQNYSLVPSETVGGDKSDVITVAGKEYVKVPAPGMKLEFYGILVQQSLATDYYTSETNLEAFKAEPVAEANFQLPEGYNVVNSADALVKNLKKAIKKNGLAISADITNAPEVIWDICK